MIIKTIIALAAVVAASFAGDTYADSFAIDHVTLIDGTGRAAKRDMTVVVDGDKIVDVSRTVAVPAVKGRRIDGKGKFLIPGIWDVHIHLNIEGLYWAKNPDGTQRVDHQLSEQILAGFLYDGVTTVIDAGNYPENILYERARERAGEIQSPHIFATGNMVTYPGAHGDRVAIRISDFEKDKALLDRYVTDEQPDIVKLTYDEEGWGTRPMIPMLPEPLMHQLVEYFNLHGIRTMVHISNEKRSIEAIYAGVDALAHPVIQGPVSDAFVKLMAAKKTPFATTLTIGENYSRLVEHPEYLDQPDYLATLRKADIQRMKTDVRKEYAARVWTQWMKLMTPIAQENIRKIDAAGGVVALGTDQSSGPATHREMELLVQAGIKPLEVIKIASHNAALYLGKADTMGSIEPEMLADMVLLNSDPLTEIDNTKDIAFVVKAGKIIDESTLPLAGGVQKGRYAPP